MEAAVGSSAEGAVTVTTVAMMPETGGGGVAAEEA